MDDTQHMVAVTALNNMMRGGHFSICVIDSIAKMLGVDPKGSAYRLLSPLHCVNWGDMPPELKAQIPGLIKDCLDVEPTYQFKPRIEVRIVEPEQPEAKQRRGILRMLTRS